MDDKLALLIGQSIGSAFLDDEEFRLAIRGPNEGLEKAVIKSEDELVKFALPSSFNSHMVSSYHATRVIEIFHSNILAALNEKKHKDYRLFFLVMHSYATEAVFGLYASSRLFEHELVKKALGEKALKISDLFKKHFPELKVARDALAHDDERIFGIVRSKIVGKTVEDMQFISLEGAILGCKDEKLEDVEFRFPTSQFMKILDEISAVLEL